ncbi:DNA recombination protein RmuC [Bifidobacterium choloepi]|uniref:DNA recombination protein RmuC n=1 Tax=Bifidobacterium choloepi TaxID=2614131 RepID=A0A6I5N1E5_9BIFI|nr:DNA recombination protein RmuC [Bifidobacterium choloepi]NEG70296.1 DNA recombination protein RmuC [Bifidobacterium choloepi]
MFENAAVGIVVLLVVAVLGVVVGYLFGRFASGSGSGAGGGLGMPGNAGAAGANRFVDVAELDAMRRQRDEEAARANDLNAQCAQLRGQCAGLQEQLGFAKGELEKAQRAENERLRAEQQRMAQEAQRREHEQAQRMAEQSKVLEALAPVQQNLDVLQRKVTQIEEGRKQEMGALGEQLKGLSEQQQRLDAETNSLSAALRNNKTRGAWGEAQLKNIVESAGLLEHVDFDTQVVVEDANGKTLRPDMVIHLPGGKTIPIDAKVPYNDYQRACMIPDTASESELRRKQELLQAHAKALREHVRALSAKEYWNALPDAPDFVIAFIPNESLLQAALEADPTLMDDAFACKVALTSPVTLWAVLKSVAYAWQQQSLTDDAKKLFDISRELYERFAVLGDRATAVGKAIAKSVGEYNKFVASLESRVLPSARKLQKLEPSKVIGEVTMLEDKDADIREITAPEAQPADSGEEE